MTEHPITPPSELIRELIEGTPLATGVAREMHLITAAFQAGADQELEACCEWLKAKEWIHHEFSDELRATRRPKPPSLKEQALDQLRSIQIDLTKCGMGISVDTIRRAIESLPD